MSFQFVASREWDCNYYVNRGHTGAPLIGGCAPDLTFLAAGDRNRTDDLPLSLSQSSFTVLTPYADHASTTDARVRIDRPARRVRPHSREPAGYPSVLAPPRTAQGGFLR